MIFVFTLIVNNIVHINANINPNGQFARASKKMLADAAVINTFMNYNVNNPAFRGRTPRPPIPPAPATSSQYLLF